MQRAPVTIRRMAANEVDLAIRWAGIEGWNPGLNDADSFFAADPEGFFLAEVKGEPAGCIAAVAYDQQFGFLGLYIVRPELRNQGIGMALWQAALAYLGDRVIGADGVVAMLDKYALSGFRIAHHNGRYQGIGQPSLAPRLLGLEEVSLAEVEGYDRGLFPAPRRAFLHHWLGQADSHFRAVRVDGQLAGYGLLRPCQQGYKIAPLFADTPALASELFAGLSGLAVNQPLFLDIPVCNLAADALAERHGMGKVFETARIYRGRPPDLPLDRIYGITSFELG